MPPPRRPPRPSPRATLTSSSTSSSQQHKPLSLDGVALACAGDSRSPPTPNPRPTGSVKPRRPRPSNLAASIRNSTELIRSSRGLTPTSQSSPGNGSPAGPPKSPQNIPGLFVLEDGSSYSPPTKSLPTRRALRFRSSPSQRQSIRGMPSRQESGDSRQGTRPSDSEDSMEDAVEKVRQNRLRLQQESNPSGGSKWITSTVPQWKSSAWDSSNTQERGGDTDSSLPEEEEEEEPLSSIKPRKSPPQPQPQPVSAEEQSDSRFRSVLDDETREHFSRIQRYRHLMKGERDPSSLFEGMTMNRWQSSEAVPDKDDGPPPHAESTRSRGEGPHLSKAEVRQELEKHRTGISSSSTMSSSSFVPESRPGTAPHYSDSHESFRKEQERKIRSREQRASEERRQAIEELQQRRAEKKRQEKEERERLQQEELRRKHKERRKRQKILEQGYGALQSPERRPAVEITSCNEDDKSTASNSSSRSSSVESTGAKVEAVSPPGTMYQPGEYETMDEGPENLEEVFPDSGNGEHHHDSPSKSPLPSSAEDMATGKALDQVPLASKPPKPTESEKLRSRSGSHREKLDSILSYLEQVDTIDPRLSSNSQDSRKAWDDSTPRVGSSTSKTGASLPTPPSNASTPSNFSSFKVKLQSTKEELASKKQEVVVLQQELDSARRAMKLAEKQHSKDLASHLDRQQKEYETAIERHLAFIDRLLADKDELSKRCEQLANDLAEVERRQASKASDQQQDFQRQLRKHKESWMAAEKVRRESWITEKEKQIKEATVKGLEPEIQRLLAKHKMDMQKAQERHEEDTRRQRLELQNEKDEELKSLRNRLMEDMQEALERERQNHIHKIRDQSEQMEELVQAERKKWMSQLDRERSDLEENLRKERASLASQREELRHKEERMAAEIQDKLEELRSTLGEKHRTEINSIEERGRQDKIAWESLMQERLESQAARKEKEIRQALEKERDQELERIISKLEEEAAAAQASTSLDCKQQIKRLKSQHKEMVSQLEEEVQSWKERCSQSSSSATSSEQRVQELLREVEKTKGLLSLKEENSRSLEDQVHSLRRECQDLKSDHEAALRTVQSDEDRKRHQVMEECQELRQLLDQCEKAKQMEIEALKKEQEEELEQVNIKLRHILQRKDETIAELQEQVNTLTQQVREYDQILDKE